MASHCVSWGFSRKPIIIGRFICKETLFIDVTGCRKTVLLEQKPRVVSAKVLSLFSISFTVAVRDTLAKAT